MGSRLGLCSGAGMNDMGSMQQDRTQRSRGRTRQGRDAQRRRRHAEGRWSSVRGRAAEFCMTCVDLLYLRHVGHRQAVSMPLSEFC
jgi:hypothetical protein